MADILIGVVDDSTGRHAPIDPVAKAQSALEASVPPGAGNDSTQGYSAGSVWIDQATGNVYTCVSAAPGAAVWSQNMINNEIDCGTF